MERTFIDFKTLKQRVSLTEVLDRYGIRLRPAGAHLLRGRCPLPTHSSKRSLDNFIANTELNVWCCLSASCCAAREGRRGGSIIDLVSAMEGCSIPEAGRKIGNWNGYIPRHSAERSQPVEQATPVPNPPLSFKLAPLDHSHPYLAQRGVSEPTARAFGVGFYAGRGSLQGRIAIPIHDQHGRIVAYAGRAIDDAVPRYRFPARFRKSRELFNLHRVTGNDVILVEGFFDCLKVWQSGYRSVVALMGCSMSSAQEQLVLQRFDNVTLFLDGDAAGIQATKSIAQRLAHRVQVQIASVPPAAQPDNLEPRVLRSVLRGHGGSD